MDTGSARFVLTCDGRKDKCPYRSVMKYAERNAAIVAARKRVPRPSLEEIGAEFGITGSRVTQILYKAGFVQSRQQDTERAGELCLINSPVSMRTYNALHRQSLCSCSQLAVMTDTEILAIRNLGSKGLQEIREHLRTHLMQG